MTHANAPLTPEGRRRLAHLVVEEGWPMRRAAERFQVSPATASRWVGRYRAGQPMEDRSCRPHHSPGRLARRTERRIIALRLNRRWGPHRIAYHLGLARSTVGRILARYNMPRLTEVDQATGLAVRRPPPVRYEKTSPGELVHLDINKLGRIPDGGGWRAHGRGSAPALAADRAKTRTRRRGSPVGGYRYIHHAIDDYSRLVYSEILDDERKETAAGFFQRANAFFKDLGITVQAVMTDNGACYRSRAFNQVLSAAGVKHPSDGDDLGAGLGAIHPSSWTHRPMLRRVISPPLRGRYPLHQQHRDCKLPAAQRSPMNRGHFPSDKAVT